MEPSLPPSDLNPLETAPLLRNIFANDSNSTADKISLALLVISENLDKPISKEKLALYESELENFSAPQLEYAFTVVLRHDTFWPPIARLRALVGCSTEQENAREALHWCLNFLRLFGAKGEPRLSCYREEEGPDGRLRMVMWKEAEWPPAIEPVLVRTLEILGAGDRAKGFEALAAHPLLATLSEMDPAWLRREIEGQFRSAYDRAKSEQASLVVSP
jgi:hypothetical protein